MHINLRLRSNPPIISQKNTYNLHLHNILRFPIKFILFLSKEISRHIIKIKTDLGMCSFYPLKTLKISPKFKITETETLSCTILTYFHP